VITSFRLLAVGVILVLAACPRKTKTDEEFKAEQEAQQRQTLGPVIEKYKDKVKPVLAGIRAAFAEAKKAPPVTEREPIAVGAELPKPETLDQVLVLGDSRSKDADPAARLNLADNSLDALARVLDGDFHDVAMIPNVLEEHLDRFKNKRWIAVVRARHYQPPAVNGHTFDGAKADGDAVLYTLADHKRVGAFPWHGVQRLDKIKVVQGYNAVTELERKFESEVLSTVAKELEAYLAGTSGVGTPGNPEADAIDARDKAEAGRFLKEKELAAAFAPVPLMHQPPILTSIDKVELAPGQPKPTVTIYTETPSALEPVRSELAAAAAKELGTEPQLRIVKSPK
jgi:hypothetical protein